MYPLGRMDEFEMGTNGTELETIGKINTRAVKIIASGSSCIVSVDLPVSVGNRATIPVFQYHHTHQISLYIYEIYLIS